MNKAVEARLKPKKEWVSPELKHIDIEKLTASTNPTMATTDGTMGKS